MIKVRRYILTLCLIFLLVACNQLLTEPAQEYIPLKYDTRMIKYTDGGMFSFKNLNGSWRDKGRSRYFDLGSRSGLEDVSQRIRIHFEKNNFAQPKTNKGSLIRRRGNYAVRYALDTGDYYGGMMIEREAYNGLGADKKVYLVDTIEHLVKVNDFICWQFDFWRLEGVGEGANMKDRPLWSRSPDAEVTCPIMIDGETGSLNLYYDVSYLFMNHKSGSYFELADLNVAMPELERNLAYALKTLEFGDFIVSQPPAVDDENHKNIRQFGENIPISKYKTDNIAIQYFRTGISNCENSCIYRHIDLRRSSGDPSGLYYDESQYTIIRIKDRPWSLKLRIKDLDELSATVVENKIYQRLKTHRPAVFSQINTEITVMPSFCTYEQRIDSLQKQAQCVIDALPLLPNEIYQQKITEKAVVLNNGEEKISAIQLTYIIKVKSFDGIYKMKNDHLNLIFQKNGEWVNIHGSMDAPYRYSEFSNIGKMARYLEVIDHK